MSSSFNESTNEIKKHNLFSNKTYDFLSALTILWLPALSTLYFTLAAIWKFPNAEQVVGTMAAVAAFLGAILRISKKAYYANESNYDGVINVTMPTPDSTLYSLDLNSDPNDINNLKQVTFKVNPYLD